MWHEARKQEKMIRGMIVDYRRRADRRREFYEKIKADPTQFLQLHGRPCKIHLDPAIASAGDSPAIMMPWQGDHDNKIDRFDARAHLDDIPEIKVPDVAPEDMSLDERNCNYERYRILAQNLFLGIGEEKFLHQLFVEEQFGVTIDEKEAQKERAAEKKGTGAAIGYNYEDSTHPPVSSGSHLSNFTPSGNRASAADKEKDDDAESGEESDLEIIDVDLSIDVNKVETAQAHAMNVCGTNFGMLGTDLFSFLTGDAHDAERQKLLLIEEKEKALFSGRKSRRERRAHRDKKLALRVASPPHYATRNTSPLSRSTRGPLSPARSLSPPEPTTNAITFITSFGGDDEQTVETDKSAVVKPTYAEKARINAESKDKTYASALRDGNSNKKRLKRSSSYTKSQRSPISPTPKNWSRSSRKRSKSWRSDSSLSDNSRSLSRSKSRSRSRKRSWSRKSSRSYSRSGSRSSDRSRSSSSSDSNPRDKRGYSKNNSGNRSIGNNSNAPGGNPGSSQNSSVRPPRYYGRKREGHRSSSSELSIDSDDAKSKSTDKSNDNLAGSKTSQVSNVVRNTAASSKQSRAAQEKLTLKERLRKKMQAQLSRQLRADKKAEAERLEREQQLQQERDDEMREMAIRIRRRQREMRHQHRTSQSSSDGDSSSSPVQSPRPREKRSHSPSPVDKSNDSEDDEKSRSPPRKVQDKTKTSAWDQEASRKPTRDTDSYENEGGNSERYYQENPRENDNYQNYNSDNRYDNRGRQGNRWGYNNRGSHNNQNVQRNAYEDRGPGNNQDYNSRLSKDSGFGGRGNWNERGGNQGGYNRFNRYQDNRGHYDNYGGPEASGHSYSHGGDSSSDRFRRQRDNAYNNQDENKQQTRRLVDY